MCLGGGSPQPLPPAPPATPVMADPAVQQARKDAQAQQQRGGLSSTQLTVNLGGEGMGNRRLGEGMRK
jgi:hypothetical protein